MSPARLDRVLIPLSRGMLELPWDSRDELIGEMRHLKSAGPAIRAFHNAGASAPVQLSRGDKMLIVEVIVMWGSQADGGMTEGLPTGVLELRDALEDDLHDVPE